MERQKAKGLKWCLGAQYVILLRFGLPETISGPCFLCPSEQLTKLVLIKDTHEHLLFAPPELLPFAVRSTHQLLSDWSLWTGKKAKGLKWFLGAQYVILLRFGFPESISGPCVLCPSGQLTRYC